MADSLLRHIARLLTLQRHRLTARGFSPAELRQDAMVFAPHPDDETLGCGGTVIRKRDLGAIVRVVFMTDGSASHPGLISAEDLARERRHEAMAATASLGVAGEHVAWLGFPDGQLAKHHTQAVTQIAALLRRERPSQIFVPFPRHEHPDHVETHTVVVEALTEAHLSTHMCEYPIWFMKRWPFVKDEPSQHERHSLRDLLGPGPLATFNVRVGLSGIVHRKREAMAEHKSQMVRRASAWHTLGDISDGEFLECFLAAELFHCIRVP